MDERYGLIHNAGFNGVALGWCGFPDNPHETKNKNPELARKNGLSGCWECIDFPYMWR